MGEGGLVDSDAELRRTPFIGGRRLHELESFLELLSYCSQLYRLRVVDHEYIVVPLTRKITVHLSGTQVRAWYI